jgi:hypothetical protein
MYMHKLWSVLSFAAQAGSTCKKSAKRSGALIFFVSFFGSILAFDSNGEAGAGKDHEQH